MCTNANSQNKVVLFRRNTAVAYNHQHVSVSSRPSSGQYFLGKVKVKCTLGQALRLCTGSTAHRGSRCIALLFHDHATRRGEGSASRPGRSLPRGESRYPLYRRLGGPQGRSGQVRKISHPTGIRSPDRPAHSQTLYRLLLPRQQYFLGEGTIGAHYTLWDSILFTGCA